MKVYVVMFQFNYGCGDDFNSDDISDIFDSEEKAREYIENHEFKFVHNESKNNWTFKRGINEHYMSVTARIDEWEVR